MAKFTFGKTVDIHWNGYEIVGPALTEFSIPDQLYEEFEGDFRGVEPSLTWTDTNEFATLSAAVSVTTLSATTPIVVSATSTGKTISISSATNPAGYYLRADGTGATTWAALPADATGITNIIGTSPISAAVVGTTATISLTGTYVNAVIGTSPASVSTASGTSTVSIVAGSINSTHLSATSVGSSQLIALSVTTAKIGSGAAAATTVLTADGSGNASFQPAASGGLDAFLLMGA